MQRKCTSHKKSTETINDVDLRKFVVLLNSQTETSKYVKIDENLNLLLFLFNVFNV